MHVYTGEVQVHMYKEEIQMHMYEGGGTSAHV